MEAAHLRCAAAAAAMACKRHVRARAATTEHAEHALIILRKCLTRILGRTSPHQLLNPPTFIRRGWQRVGTFLMQLMVVMS